MAKGEDDSDDELLVELYGASADRKGTSGGSAGYGCCSSLLVRLLISAMLIATPWRGDSLGILSLRKVYGRPPCALEAPCTVVAPFDFAAGSAAEREGQLLLSMEANGVAILRGAVSVSTVAATRADLTNKLAVFTAEGGDKSPLGAERGPRLAWAPGIKEPEQREHVQLDTDAPTSLLAEAFGSGTVLANALSRALGEDAMMVELAVIRSHPGAGAQQLHADTTPRLDRRDGLLWTVFIPLQGVDVDMGPLQVCAGSHSCLPAFGDLEGDTSRWCDRHCQTITTAPGDIYLIDSRVHHRGNRHALTATTSRFVLYASFVQSTVVGPHSFPSKPYLRALFPIGSTLAMHENLWGACTLRSLGHLSDEQRTLERAVPVSAAQAALRAARNRSNTAHSDQPAGTVDVEARRRLFWDAAVLHSATTQQIAPDELACWEIDLTKVDCMLASLEVTIIRSLVEVPERGLGLFLGMVSVIQVASSSLLSRSIIAVAMLLPVASAHLVAHRDPVPGLELLSIGLQLAAFECGCMVVLVALQLTKH